MPNSEDDYYQRLQVSKDASPQQIKAAFRRLARRYHPDLNPDNPAAREKFQALREAYEVLIDQVLRQRYDQTRNPQDFQAVDQVPKTPQEFYMRGIQHTLARDYQAAYDDYTEALEQQPDFGAAYLRRAQVRYVLGDDAGVLADCQRLLTSEGENVQAFYYQGLARYRLGYTQSAIAAFTAAIALEPDDPQIYYQRGIAHEDIQEREPAIADFQTAARYFQEQGDLLGRQRAQEQLQQLQVPVSQFSPRRKMGVWPRWPRISQFNQLFFGLLGNPVGELLPIHSRLDARQATEVGCLLGLIAVASFTLCGYVLRFGEPTRLTLFSLWMTGSVAFLSLLLMLAFSRAWFRRRGRWSTDVYIAGATLLPMGIFALVTPIALIFPWLWVLLWLFTLTHTILTLYTSCTQLQHFSELTATWIVPSVLFVSLSMAYLVLRILL
jgi:curved DNA-binding protein CbpA